MLCRAPLCAVLLLLSLPLQAWAAAGFLDVSSSTKVDSGEAITSANGFLYVTSEDLKVRVLSAGRKYKTKPRPRVVGYLKGSENAKSVHHGEYYTYVVTEEGVSIYAQRHPFSRKAEINVANAAFAAPCGEHLYVFCHTSDPMESLAVLYDIAAIGSPEEINRLILKKGRVVHITVSRGIVFAGTSEAYIMVLDPTKKQPKYQLRSSTSTPRVPAAMTSFLEFIYVGVGNTMRVYLTAIPELIQEMAKVKFDYPVVDLWWFGGNVYVVSDKKLYVVCVMDPVKPFHIAETSFDSPPKSITVLNDTAWIITTDEELWSLPAVPPPNDDGGAGDTTTKFTPTPDVERSKIFTKPMIDFEPVETRNGMPAWQYLLGSRYEHVPDFMISSTVLTAGKSQTFVPRHSLKEGTQLMLKCKDRMCNVFIHVEYCTPCSAKTNGGLPAVLVQEGWHSTTCSPSFRLSPTGKQHKMITFRKQFRVNETRPLATLTRDGMFVGVTVSEGREMCDEIMKESECNVGSVMCTWDVTIGACVPRVPENICQEDPGKYNAGNCRTCAATELEEIVQRVESELEEEREYAEAEEKARKIGDIKKVKSIKAKLKKMRARKDDRLRELEGVQ